MPRRFLSLLTVLAFATAVVLAIARPGALSHQGTFTQPAIAVADAEPSATLRAYIDKIENGAGWCDPENIDTTTTEYVGDSHQLAICIGNLVKPVGGFSLVVSYDYELDGCLDEDCPAQGACLGLDDNPDANAGVTKWPPDSAGLGTGWDCYQPELQEPRCDYTLPSANGDDGETRAKAFIHCAAVQQGATYTLGDNEAWGVLAVIDLSVLAAGTDEVEFESLQIWGDDLRPPWSGDQTEPMAECDTDDNVTFGAALNGTSAFVMDCVGATDIKQPPERHRRPTSTPTPEPTATPTTEVPTVPPPPPATPTPSGGAGPAIVAPTTGSGPTGSGDSWALWLAAGLAGAALAAGGFCIRYARSDR